MTKELKANAQNQHSNIGGGHYGYLPLVIPEVEFLALPNTEAVVFPAAPPPFNVDPFTAAIQSMVHKSQWETDTRAHLEHL